MPNGEPELPLRESASFRLPDNATFSAGATSWAPVGDVTSQRRPVDQSGGRRRTPRKSLIVVLPDSHALRVHELADRLPVARSADEDLIVACSGHATDFNALRQLVGDAQFLVAPPGTSAADLRQLAMTQAPGDIVTLLNAALLLEPPASEQAVPPSS